MCATFRILARTAKTLFPIRLFFLKSFHRCTIALLEKKEGKDNRRLQSVEIRHFFLSLSLFLRLDPLYFHIKFDSKA
jgi:hypothetical protein